MENKGVLNGNHLKLIAALTMLLDHAGIHRDVADPWYYGNFDQTWEDVCEGCQKILEELV